MDDPSAFVDAARGLVAARSVTRDIGGQIESQGFAIVGGLVRELDPALREAIVEHLSGAAMLHDPAALLMGRAEVRDTAGVMIEAADPAVSMERAVAILLASRGGCADAAQALDLTAAALRVITPQVPRPLDQ